MANIQKRYDLFIDGKFVPASDGKTFEAHNPANGEVLASFAEATREDVDLACLLYTSPSPRDCS